MFKKVISLITVFVMLLGYLTWDLTPIQVYAESGGTVVRLDNTNTFSSHSGRVSDATTDPNYSMFTFADSSGQINGQWWWKSTGKWMSAEPQSVQSVSFHFTGTAASLYMKKFNFGGIVKVYIDGELKSTIDTYVEDVDFWSAPGEKVFELTGLTAGAHTIKVETADSSAAAKAAATAAGGDAKPEVIIDAFEYITPETGGEPPPDDDAEVVRLDNTNTFSSHSGRVSDATADPNYSMFTFADSSGQINGQWWWKSTGKWMSAEPQSVQSVSFHFTGTAVSLYMKKFNFGGIVKVYIDGELKSTIDTYVEDVDFWSAPGTKVFEQTGLTAGEHTIKVETAGSSAAAQAAVAAAITGGDSEAKTETIIDAFEYITPKSSGEDGEAATYYVNSAGGSDDNDGTSESTAWKTLAKVNGTTFKAGDKILFKSGSAWNEILTPKGSGEAGKPIIIDMYGGGVKPIISGTSTSRSTVTLSNLQYWEINNLEITNNGTKNQRVRRGITVEGTNGSTLNHIYLRNLYVHDTVGYDYVSSNGTSTPSWDDWDTSCGIFVSVVNDTYMNDILIDSCKIEKCVSKGIVTNSYNSGDKSGLSGGSIFNAVITNNIVDSNAGDGIVLGGANAARVERNVSRYSHKGCPAQNAAGIWAIGGWNNVFQYNEAYLTQTTLDGMGFDCDWSTQGTVMQYNYSHDNVGGFMLVCSDGSVTSPPRYNRNSIVRYNISENDATATFHLAGPVQGTRIYNNTVYIGSGVTGDVVLHGNWSGYANDTAYYNNIFYVLNNGGYKFGQSTNTVFENNAFFGNHPTSEPADGNKITADPMLVDPGSGDIGLDTVGGYKLQSGSPMINAGKVIKDNGGLDYWGNPVSSTANPNIGADNSYNVLTPSQAGNTVFSSAFDANAAGWTPFTGVWTVSGGKYGVSADGGVSSAGERTWTDYSVSADVTPSQGSSNLYFRYNGDLDNTYYASISEDGEISINRVVKGTTLVLAAGNTSSATTYKMAVEADGGTIKLYVDDTLALTAFDAYFTSGGIAIGANQCAANFDNVTVADLSAVGESLFSDDFSDGAASWTVVDGEWTAVDGVYVTGSSAEHVDYSSLSDFTLTVDITPTAYQGTGYNNVYLRSRDANNGYYVTTSNGAKGLALTKIAGGTQTHLQDATFSFAANTKYTLKIVTNGSNIKVYVDGTERLNVTDSTYASGSIAFNAWHGEADFDNLVVNDLSENVIIDEDFETDQVDFWSVSQGSFSIVDDGTGANKVYRLKNLDGAHSTYVGPMPGGVTYAGNSEWDNYALLADVTPAFSGGSGSVNLYFRYTDAGNTYYAALNKNNTVSISKVSGGLLGSLASAKRVINGGQKYTVKIVASGSILDLYIDGVKVLTAADSSLKKGKIGLSAVNSNATFDNIVVFDADSLTSPEPPPFVPKAVTASYVSDAPQIETVADWINGSDTKFEIRNNDIAEEDCSGIGRLNWDEDNFYLSLIVQDDSHVQTETAANSWRGDGLQIAIDTVRATNPGGAGHTEFNYALHESGTILAYGQGVGEAGHVLTSGNTKIVHDDETATTTYVIVLPWADIFKATDKSVISEGGLLGFSMLINDVDKNDDGSNSIRAALEYNSGISSGKDPTLYGDLNLVASSTSTDKTYAELQTLIGQANAKEEDDYTPESWAPFAQALDAAKLIEPDAQPEDITAAYEALENAINALVGKSDKTVLGAAIDSAEALTGSDYTSASWTVLENALEAALYVFADPNATQAEVDSAKADLLEAIVGLVLDNPDPDIANKSALQALIAITGELLEVDHTAASWADLETALAEASNVESDPNATQAQVDAAALALKNAINALVKKADKAALGTAIASAEALTGSDYTTESWAALQTALAKAKAIAAKDGATQTEVRTALDDLNAAMDALVSYDPGSVPSPGSDKSKRSSGGTSKSGPDTRTFIPAGPKPVDKTTAVNEARKAASGDGVVRFKNVGMMTLDIMKAMINAGNGKNLKVRTDSMTANGEAVEVRISFTLMNATKDVNLYGSISHDRTKHAKSLFGKWFKNKVVVIHLDQKGSFGMTVEVAAKVDLAGMNTKNLYFYSYDKESNTYALIKNPKHWIDANGYLHFLTTLGGDIIVSDGPLAQK